MNDELTPAEIRGMLRIKRAEIEERMQENEGRLARVVGPLYGEIFGHLGRFGEGGLSAAIWHDEGYKEHDVDAEAVVFIKNRVPESERVKVYQLPAATMASIVHKGAYSRLNQAYEAVMRWIEANGYKIAGRTASCISTIPNPCGRTTNRA